MYVKYYRRNKAQIARTIRYAMQRKRERERKAAEAAANEAA